MALRFHEGVGTPDLVLSCIVHLFCGPLKRENYRFLEYATLEKGANVGEVQSGERRARIDYLFHLPSMIAALVLAYCFFSLLRERSEKRTSVR
jgi:hypothetical protein